MSCSRTQRSDASEALTCDPSVSIKHSTTEPLGSPKKIMLNYIESWSVVQQEMLFKRFLIWRSGSPPVWWIRTINAILKEGIMQNTHVKL